MGLSTVVPCEPFGGERYSPAIRKEGAVLDEAALAFEAHEPVEVGPEVQVRLDVAEVVEENPLEVLLVGGVFGVFVELFGEASSRHRGRVSVVATTII